MWSILHFMLECATFQFHACCCHLHLCCCSQAEKSDNNLVKSKGQIIVKLTEGKGNHIKSLLPNNVCGCESALPPPSLRLCVGRLKRKRMSKKRVNVSCQRAHESGGRERGNGEDNANGLEVFLVLVAATRARC